MLLTVLLAIAASQPAPGKPVTTLEGVTEYRLENGLRLLVVPDMSSGTFTLLNVAFAGQMDDPTGKRAMVHLIEHVSALGTQHHPNLPQEISSRGDLGDALTGPECVRFYTLLPYSKSNLEFALNVEADRIRSPLYTQERINRELSAMRAEQSLKLSKPAILLETRALGTAYADHSYHQWSLSDELENITPADVADFHDKVFRPDNVLFIVSGPVEPASLYVLVQRYFGDIANPHAPPYRRSERVLAPQTGERRVEFRREGAPTSVLFGFRTPPAMHTDTAALAVLAQLLQGEHGPGLKEGSSFKGTDADIEITQEILSQGGFFSVFAKTPRGWTQKHTEQALEDALRGLQFDPKRVAQAKNEVLQGWETTFDNSYRLSEALAIWQSNSDWRGFFLFRNRVRMVGLEDVKRVAKTYFSESNRTVAVLTNDPHYVPLLQTATGILPVIESELRSPPTTPSPQNAVESFDWTPAALQARTIRGTLHSGLRFALIPVHLRGNRAVVALTLHQVRASDPALLSLAADVLLRGTTSITRETLEARFREMDTTADVFPVAGGISLRFETKRDHLTSLIGLLSEIIKEPAFTANDIDSAKSNAAHAIGAASLDVVKAATQSALARLYRPATDGRPYRQSLDEKLAHIQSADARQVAQTYRSLVTQGAAELVVVGSFDSLQVRGAAEQAFDGFRFLNAPPPLQPDAPPGSVNRQLISNSTGAALCAAATLPSPSPEGDYVPLQVGALVLVTSDYSVSRLGKRIRMQDHLSYHAGGRIAEFPDMPATTIFMVFSYAPDKMNAVVLDLEDEVGKATSTPFSAAELTLGKQLWANRRRVALSNPSTLAQIVTSQLARGTDFLEESRIAERVANVSAEEVTRSLRLHLSMSSFQVSFASP